METPVKKSRPQKRTLVRWTDDIDKRVLLCIQWACADNGIKIPWKKIATQLGPEFTEGAIVQHLAKLRLKMIDMEMDVPPALKRGTVTKGPSSFYANPARSRKILATPTKIKSEESGANSVRSSGKTGGRTRKRAKYESDESSDQGDEYGSDSDEYGSANRNNKEKKKSRPASSGEKDKQSPRRKDNNRQIGSGTGKVSSIEGAVDTPTVKNESMSPNAEDDAGPAMRTRGIRQDYAKFGKDEEDFEDDEGVEVGQNFRDDQPNGRLNIRDEGSYSPRNTTNTANSPAPTKFGTPTMDLNGNHKVSYSSPAAYSYFNSAPFNAQGAPAFAYPATGRGSMVLQSPHGSSFSSSRTASMNSSMMMNHMQPGVYETATTNVSGVNFGFQTPSFSQNVQPSFAFNTPSYTGNDGPGVFLSGNDGNLAENFGDNFNDILGEFI